jgi:hypothetical protein
LVGEASAHVQGESLKALASAGVFCPWEPLGIRWSRCSEFSLDSTQHISELGKFRIVSNGGNRGIPTKGWPRFEDIDLPLYLSARFKEFFVTLVLRRYHHASIAWADAYRQNSN